MIGPQGCAGLDEAHPSGWAAGGHRLLAAQSRPCFYYVLTGGVQVQIRVTEVSQRCLECPVLGRGGV